MENGKIILLSKNINPLDALGRTPLQVALGKGIDGPMTTAHAIGTIEMINILEKMGARFILRIRMGILRLI
jgi:hypothetical protein